MATPAVPDGFTSLVLRCAILGTIPITLAFNRLIGKSHRLQAGTSWLSFLMVALTGLAWQAIVSLWVPEPYLDEFFHIPQAQKYCDGYWYMWDDKITTPPGLYLFSVATHRLWWLLMGSCSPLTLRMTNWLVIITLPVVASQCRQLIETRLAERGADPRTQRLSQQHTALSSYALHTGTNIAFFPLLFFFSGLYYTDVLSTLVVLVAFWNTLSRIGNQADSWRSDFLVVLLGIASLFMRQTNVFWVVVFMGGLEAVHAAGALRPPPTRPGEFDRLTMIKFHLSRYSQGEIHDPRLDDASLDDIFYCAFSIAIAVICNPLRVIRQIWPHVLTMVLFAGFVFWNGGVVLGDKSNHVATIHLPQMLYIWPLFAFFSAPLLLPTVLQPVLILFSPAFPSSSSSKAAPTTSTLSKVFNIAGYISLVPTALAIVKFNTIIHPFTLADNRHYMFYIFRYSILRAPWVRYALVPIYIISGILCMKSLGGTPSSSWPETNTSSEPARKATSSTNQEEEKHKPTDSGTSTNSIDAPTTTVPPSLSTTLLLLLTTTLSLMTAPLVEPRYFILPWVFWRLFLPSWSWYVPQQQQQQDDNVNISRRSSSSSSSSSSSPVLAIATTMSGVDLRLWLETMWFGLINVVTMYIFITKPFQWASEEGMLQRFMW